MRGHSAFLLHLRLILLWLSVINVPRYHRHKRVPENKSRQADTKHLDTHAHTHIFILLLPMSSVLL